MISWIWIRRLFHRLLNGCGRKMTGGPPSGQLANDLGPLVEGREVD